MRTEEPVSENHVCRRWRSIARGCGLRRLAGILRRDLGDEPTLPTELQHLLDQLKAYDDRNENHPTLQRNSPPRIGQIDRAKPHDTPLQRTAQPHATDRVDCLGERNVPQAIEFWCAALNYEPLRAPSVDWAILVLRSGEFGPQLAISQVSDGISHQRHHLDLYASEQEAEVQRLLNLGARRVEWRLYPESADYVVLADPDGNTFCVVRK